MNSNLYCFSYVYNWVSPSETWLHERENQTERTSWTRNQISHHEHACRQQRCSTVWYSFIVYMTCTWQIITNAFVNIAGQSHVLTTVTLWAGSCCLTSPTAAPSRTSMIGWRRLAVMCSHTASSSCWWAINVTWRRSARCVLVERKHWVTV